MNQALNHSLEMHQRGALNAGSGAPEALSEYNGPWWPHHLAAALRWEAGRFVFGPERRWAAFCLVNEWTTGAGRSGLDLPVGLRPLRPVWDGGLNHLMTLFKELSRGWREGAGLRVLRPLAPASGMVRVEINWDLAAWGLEVRCTREARWAERRAMLAALGQPEWLLDPAGVRTVRQEFGDALNESFREGFAESIAKMHLGVGGALSAAGGCGAGVRSGVVGSVARDALGVCLGGFSRADALPNSGSCGVRGGELPKLGSGVADAERGGVERNEVVFARVSCAKRETGDGAGTRARARLKTEESKDLKINLKRWVNYSERERKEALWELETCNDDNRVRVLLCVILGDDVIGKERGGDGNKWIMVRRTKRMLVNRVLAAVVDRLNDPQLPKVAAPGGLAHTYGESMGLFNKKSKESF